MIINWTRGNAPQHVAQHFDLSEFECPCGKCQNQMIDTDLLEGLDRLRERVGGPIHVDDGYRCPAHNTSVGGVSDSKHMHGKAADIKTQELSIEEFHKLAEQFFQRIGLGHAFLHVDVAPGKAEWVYNF